MTAILPPSSLPPIFQYLLNHNECISHMLFVGPPGSGKTTTALSFASALHGSTTNKFASILFMNSSDERSLETMRQKVYPFVESRMQSLFFSSTKQPPKVIVFDEAETLTDQAQCALRPLLQRSTKDVILIFICNSLSHIHPNIITKFICIPFPPIQQTRVTDILKTHTPPYLDLLFRRGDLRYFKLDVNHSAITQTLFQVLHATSVEDVIRICMQPGTPFRDRLTWILLFLHGIGYLQLDTIPLWSALSASETQPFLSYDTLSKLFRKMWIPTYISLTPPPV